MSDTIDIQIREIKTQESNAQIHESVREHYGRIASQQQSSCCGGGSSTKNADEPVQVAADCGCSKGYDAALLEDLPTDVKDLSLGCGDPVTIASLKPGERVLDLGSGGGIDCFMAAKQVGETGFVIGLDMTPAMLEKANAAKARMNAHNVEFRRGQIEDMPVKDHTIDVIMSNCVINLSPDKKSVFEESFRVLKPGGRVSISDIVLEGQFPTELKADMENWAACVTGAIDINIYTGLMREAGFTDITVVDKAEVGIPDEARAGRKLPRVYSARITARKPG